MFSLTPRYSWKPYSKAECNTGSRANIKKISLLTFRLMWAWGTLPFSSLCQVLSQPWDSKATESPARAGVTRVLDHSRSTIHMRLQKTSCGAKCPAWSSPWLVKCYRVFWHEKNSINASCYHFFWAHRELLQLPETSVGFFKKEEVSPKQCFKINIFLRLLFAPFYYKVKTEVSITFSPKLLQGLTAHLLLSTVFQLWEGVHYLAR